MTTISQFQRKASPAFSLLGVLFSLVILAILAVLLLQALGGKKSEQMEALLGEPTTPTEVPAWDGSLESKLPDGIEAKVRAVQDQAAQRQAELEKMLENSY